MRGYDPLNKVTPGNHAHYRSLVEHWKVTDAVIRHYPHALVNGFRFAYDNHRSRHDVPNERLPRRPALQDDFARIIAFGNDSGTSTRAWHIRKIASKTGAVGRTGQKSRHCRARGSLMGS